MDVSVNPDEDLDRAREGDREAFNRLMRPLLPRLESVVRRRMGAHLGRTTEVADLVQETLLRAFGSLKSFRGENPGSLSAWLSSIAVRVVQDQGRRRKRAGPMEVSLSGGGSGSSDGGSRTAALPARDPTPSRTLRRDDRLERLRKALDSLTPDQRKVVELARLEGRPIREVAERMERTPNAVSMLLLRALQQLRRHFGTTESLHLPREGLDRLREDDDRAS